MHICQSYLSFKVTVYLHVYYHSQSRIDSFIDKRKLNKVLHQILISKDPDVISCHQRIMLFFDDMK